MDYDYFVIIVDTSNQFAGFKVNQSHWNAKTAISDTAEKIKTDKLVAIIGAGPTGVETASEISSNIKSIKVTLYTGRIGLLTDFSKRKAGATAELEKVGVNITNGEWSQICIVYYCRRSPSVSR